MVSGSYPLVSLPSNLRVSDNVVVVTSSVRMLYLFIYLFFPSSTLIHDAFICNVFTPSLPANFLRFLSPTSSPQTFVLSLSLFLISLLPFPPSIPPPQSPSSFHSNFPIPSRPQSDQVLGQVPRERRKFCI